MAAYLTVYDLKNIRNVYNALGISNSAVLDQVKLGIQTMHFDEDAIMEIKDIFSDYQTIREKIVSESEPKLSAYETATLGKVELIDRCQIISNVKKLEGKR